MSARGDDLGLPAVPPAAPVSPASLAPLAAPRSTAPRLPDLDILARLGEGGMGTVWQARERSLERTVAVKVLRRDLLEDPDLRRRFEREARALAHIRHPGIVEVYRAGEHEGLPYYVMRLVEGDTFERWLAGPGRDDPRAAARARASAARAVDAAHRAGVLHRDLKPANILVDGTGEPIVVDFGLAKRVALDHDESLSAREPVLGTPDYLAPEVAAGEAHTEAADIYGLGATLYRALTGQVPFAGSDLLDKLRRIQHDEPELPRRLAPAVPEALQAICLVAMERRPEDRYASAAALARDLERFLAGEPVEARPTLYQSLLERRVRGHLDAIEGWEREGVLTARERDHLAWGYERFVETERDSIFELERLSAGIVMLYVGALVIALGPAVLLTVGFDASPWEGRAGVFAYRLLVAGGPLLALSAAGAAIWRRGDLRAAIPLLFGACLLAAPCAFVLLHEVPGLREARLDAFSLLARPAAEAGGGLARALDRKLLGALLVGLACALALRRATRAPAFYWAAAVAALGVYLFGAIELGWRGLARHWQAFWLLWPGLAVALAGVRFDLRGHARDARPFFLVGFGALALAWSAYAALGYPLEHLGPWARGEAVPLSFVAGGVVALGLALACEALGTRLLRRYAVGPYLLAAAGVLIGLSALVEKKLALYEVLLVLACLGFVALSVGFQRKHLLYSGSVYLSVAVLQISRNHFREAWGWPVVLVATGASVIVTAYFAPRLYARVAAARIDAAQRPASLG